MCNLNAAEKQLIIPGSANVPQVAVPADIASLAACSTSRARARVPQPLAERLNILPVSLFSSEAGDLLSIIASKPLQAEQLAELQFAASAELSVETTLVTTDEVIYEACRLAYGRHGARVSEQTSIAEQQTLSDSSKAKSPAEDLALGDDNELFRLLQVIVQRAECLSASDIILEPEASQTAVRYRVRGCYEKQWADSSLSPELATRLTSLIKILAKLDISEQRRPQEGSFICPLESTTSAGQVKIRVSIVAAHFGPRVALRLFAVGVGNDEQCPRLSDLNLAKDITQMLSNFASRSHGTLLVCGPTGSGKTTLLYSLLGELATDERAIVSIEDPVECAIAGASQLEVSEHLGLGYHELLKASMRQDPDVLLVGEIRDAATAETALEAGLTGHLVLSTIHAASEVDVLLRLSQFECCAGLVAASLRLIVSIRLVNKICFHCARQRVISEIEAQLLSLSPATEVLESFGCARCNRTGHLGVVPVVGFMPLTEGFVDELCASKSTHWNPVKLRAAAIKAGYQPLPLALRQLVMIGTISVKSARQAIGQAKNFSL